MLQAGVYAALSSMRHDRSCLAQKNVLSSRLALVVRSLPMVFPSLVSHSGGQRCQEELLGTFWPAGGNHAGPAHLGIVLHEALGLDTLAPFPALGRRADITPASGRHNQHDCGLRHPQPPCPITQTSIELPRRPLLSPNLCRMHAAIASSHLGSSLEVPR